MLHQSAEQFQPPSKETDPPCRVADIAKRFGEAEKQWHAIDGLGDKDAEATNELMMDALCDAAAFDQARSALGILFQVCIVSGCADRLRDFADETKQPHVRREIIRLDSALWSVRRFVEAHFGTSVDAIGGDYLMPERCSYLTKLAACCAPRDLLQAAE